MNRPAFDFARILDPRSVAVVGASPGSRSPASEAGIYLSRAPEPPRIYYVNPRHAGQPDYFESVAALPEVPDVVIVAIRADMVLHTIAAAAAAGAKAFVVFTGGFAEAGSDGARLQDELAELAQEKRLTLIGPNCLGVMNFVSGKHLSFSSALGREVQDRRAGFCALVSQSGALASYLCAMTERSPVFNYVFSVGNEACVGTADIIDHLAADGPTRAIALYLEGVRDGARLLGSIARARAAGKEVVVLPVGEGEAGARAASSHTAALASSNALTRLLVEKLGAVVVDTPEQLAAAVSVLGRFERPANSGVGIVTVTGGGGAILAEQVEKSGLDVVELQQPTRDALAAVLPAYMAPANPCDTGTAFYSQPDLLTRSIEALSRDAGVGQVITVMGSGGVQSAAVATAIAAADSRMEKPHQVIWFAAPPEATSLKAFAPVALAPTLADAVAVARALARPCSRSWENMIQDAPFALTAEAVRSIEAIAARGRGGFMPEGDARALLAAAGLPVAHSVFVPADRVNDADALLASFPFPAAAKVSSPQIQHKTEVGGVMLDIPSAAGIDAILDEASRRVVARAPDAVISGWTVEQMAPRGHEVLVTVRRDPSYGAVVVVGSGGVATELRRDINAHRAPIGPAAARRLLQDTEVGHLINGFRGAKTDLSSVAKLISALSAVISAVDAIIEIECNPVVVPAGGQPVIIDVLVRC